MSLLREVVGDAVSLARIYRTGRVGLRELGWTVSHDGLHVLVLSRIRAVAQKSHIPFVGGIARRAQTVLFGVEISREARLGEGVVFLHTVGIVIGGDTQIGDRVVFLGSNTLGSLDERGYPRVGNDVIIGAGARILGPVTIGDGARIGANAVVLCDVPAGATATGVPAVVRPRGVPAGVPATSEPR